MRKAITSALPAAALLVFASMANGHHSVAQGFDMNETVTITGTIKEMEWINPHARLFVEVEGANGEVQSWTAWFSSANNLFRRGWRDTDLPVGETITVSGFPARDGSPELYGGETTLADGRTLFGGTAPAP